MELLHRADASVRPIHIHMFETIPLHIKYGRAVLVWRHKQAVDHPFEHRVSDVDHLVASRRDMTPRDHNPERPPLPIDTITPAHSTLQNGAVFLPAKILNLGHSSAPLDTAL